MTLPGSRFSTVEDRFQAGDHSRINHITEMDGEADTSVPVIHFRDHKFELDVEALKRILLQDEVKDRSVVVLSVAGAFRKGKSFILNFFLRYLNHTYGSASTTNGDWLGSPDQPLTGFSWRGGSERDTTGILMWSRVFLTTLEQSKEKVAIILMDTQGTFDSGSTVRECATVFALSTLISSIQIYNISSNIHEDDLQHLQLFSDFGKLAMLDSGKVPFQRLLFLIRDWYYVYEAEYGEAGGKKFLQKRLEVSPDQKIELQSTRRHIKSCFSDISCFLMPFPGLKVTSKLNFDGKLSEIDKDFIKSLRELVVTLLSPEKLLVKEICGQKVKAKDLLQYFQSYVAVYSGDELPEPKTLLAATAEANNVAAINSAKDHYLSQMEASCGSSKPHVVTSVLTAEHERVKTEALLEFDSKRKMGGEEFSESYRSKLQSDLEEMFNQFKRYNQMKGAPTHTPAVFLALAALSYVASTIFGVVGLITLASIGNFCLTVSLLTLIVWIYAKYTGEIEEVGEGIDSFSYALWEGALKPSYLAAMSRAVKQTSSYTVLQNTQAPTFDSSGKEKTL